MATGVVTAKYLRDIAEAIRVQSGSESTITPSQMAAAIIALEGVDSPSIVKSSDNSQGLVTDSILTGIANAIRTKLDVQTQYTPAQMADAILLIQPSGVTIVPWSSGTDEEIAAIVSALDSGDISVQDTGWQIGDERVVSLSAMPATYVGEAQPAQNVTMVLMDSGHYDLVSGGKDHFVVGVKPHLSAPGYMNNNSNQYRWDNCGRRSWCNSIFRDALPQSIKGCFKQFKTKQIKAYRDQTIAETEDYFSLFAQFEVVGHDGDSYKYGAYPAESNVLSQIEYFKTPSNRATGSIWSLRSPTMGSLYTHCVIWSTGSPDNTSQPSSHSIRPFGCI